jgi:hypothetical protein
LANGADYGKSLKPWFLKVMTALLPGASGE